MDDRPASEGLRVGDVLVCSHPDCPFTVVIKDVRARESTTAGPMYCVCGAMMLREGEKQPKRK